MRHPKPTILVLATMMMFMLAPSMLSHLQIPSVYAASPDFSVSANPTEVDIPQGGSVTLTITVTSLYNYTGTVSPPPPAHLGSRQA